MSAEATSDHIPSLPRRLGAKAIDLFGVAFTVVGFTSVTGSYVVGLLIGYGWLALSDFGGSLGKWALKLEVRNHETGGECSAWSSVVRNLPIIATALPQRLHQALLGMDRPQYVQTHTLFMFVMWCFLLIVFVQVAAALSRDVERRHIGDSLAGTVVVHRKRKTSSSQSSVAPREKSYAEE